MKTVMHILILAVLSLVLYMVWDPAKMKALTGKASELKSKYAKKPVAEQPAA